MARTLSFDDIVDAADRLVRAEGLDALSMRRLAAELKVAHSGLYSHNIDRQVLLVALLDQRMGPVVAAMEARTGLAPTERLVAFARMLLDQHRGCPTSRSITMALLDDGVLAAGATGADTLDRLETLIDQACIELAGSDEGAIGVRTLFDAASRAPLISGPAGPRSDPPTKATVDRLLAGLRASLPAPVSAIAA